MKVALITEGVSEYRVIKHIIAKYFKEREPEINQIQPEIVNDKQETPGGWNEVLKYCERADELNEIFRNNDYLVIQIDTDQSQQTPFNINHTKQDGTLKSHDELHTDVLTKLSGLIKQEIRETHGNKIFYAICIHTVECWLLPIYYNDNHKTHTQNCLNALNRAFRKNNIHVITPNNKNKPNGIRSYEEALKNWKRKNDIKDASECNEGFKRLIKSFSAAET